MNSPRDTTIIPFVAAAVCFGALTCSAQAQTTGGGTSGGSISGGITGGGATSRSGIPTTTPSPVGRADPLADERAPSPVTRREQYDRLPDEPGPDYNPRPSDPLGKNPASALGPQSEFPDRYITDTRRDSLMPEADHRQLRPDSKVVPRNERVTGGMPSNSARPRDVRRMKEETAVDTMSECMDSWDPKTHMDKDKWEKTCSRTLEKPHM
jgi:hypothetical protein